MPASKPFAGSSTAFTLLRKENVDGERRKKLSVLNPAAKLRLCAHKILVGFGYGCLQTKCRTPVFQMLISKDEK